MKPHPHLTHANPPTGLAPKCRTLEKFCKQGPGGGKVTLVSLRPNVLVGAVGTRAPPIYAPLSLIRGPARNVTNELKNPLWISRKQRD